MTISTTDRPGQASAPEDLFVDLFAEVFGAEKAQLLAHEYPFQDIYGGGRFIDYALKTLDSRIAFEIDGLEWHLPGSAAVPKFEDDLLRQNSLIHMGWQVYRWTDRQILAEPERVKEELAKFLESIPNLVSFDDFLPRQRGELVELRQHQEDALASLAAMRAEGKTGQLRMRHGMSKERDSQLVGSGFTPACATRTSSRCPGRDFSLRPQAIAGDGHHKFRLEACRGWRHPKELAPVGVCQREERRQINTELPYNRLMRY
jgi:very-short-patch-repair endonuclease